MRKVSEEDWKESYSGYVMNAILENLIIGQKPDLHFTAISLLYKRYRLGDWNNKIPDPNTIPDKEYLVWGHDEYCLFHTHHAKFGKHIIECADPFRRDVFVFFDFFSLNLAFKLLDSGNASDQLSYIPTYYAHPYDRHDYRTTSDLWI